MLVRMHLYIPTPFSCTFKKSNFSKFLAWYMATFKHTVNVLFIVFYCRYSKPISVAKKVLEHSSVNMLVGSGAKDFAADNGFILEENSKLLFSKTAQVRMYVYEVKILRVCHDYYCNCGCFMYIHVYVGVYT